MRRAYKVWTGIAAGVFCLVACSDLTSTPTTPATPAVSVAAAPVAVPAPAAPVGPVAPGPGAPAAAARGDRVTVTEVIDGDTFVASGRKVRVLGIDSCEMSTFGGRQAKQTAETLLEGQQVTLTREPGVDEDKYGRSLRYVATSYGSDFGESMVVSDHTGVYEGTASNASADYLAGLRDRDYGDRDCSAPAGATSSGSSYDTDVDLPGPTPGNQGLPDGALTGGFCAKKKWC